jgi:hypothetical protein|tara:strand:+ start:48152 stop:48523 length:372 start_codon:yes stop_codon:yes gene_type:complete
MKYCAQKIADLTCWLALSMLLQVNVIADETQAPLEPPTIEQHSVELRTVYKYSLFPGVRPCDEPQQNDTVSSENCQSPELIKSLSTRDQRIYALERGTIVHERVAPNGNILRLNFSRKAFRDN